MSVVFFDIGATLADAHLEPDGSLSLHPRPRVIAVLDTLRKVRKGIISNPGPGEGAAARAADALAQAFPGRFTDADLIHWGVKDGRGIFDEAVASTGGTPAHDCVFVGEGAEERAFARKAGMRSAVHPVFTRAALEDRPVLRAQIEMPADQAMPALAAAADKAEVVLLRTDPERPVPAMATRKGAETLERAGFPVDVQGPVEGMAAPRDRNDVH